jgi:NSS family neurotransmitter:Na+ symporter
MAKTHWSSHLVFMLACIGSAVGVGNIWRFPYLAAENGGGTFILVYLFAILLLGFPVLLLELLAGKALSSSPLKSFEKIKKNWTPLYYANFLIVILLFSYYVVITGWTLGYLVLSLGGAVSPFADFSSTYLPVVFTFAVMAILFFVMRVNIKQGLEKVNSIILPLLYVILLFLLYEAVKLPAFPQAIQYYTSIDVSKLLMPSFWLVVISQAIFSLSIGQGIMLAYGAYLSKKEELVKSSLAIVSADTAASLLASLIVFGFMFSFAIPPNTGPSLSFEALPHAFQQMEFGSLIMPVFFLLLFGAALTSAVSLAEVIIFNFMDMLKITRKTATLACIVLISILMIPSALSYSPLNLSIFGEKFFDFLDVSVVGRFLPLTTLFTIVYIAWGYKDLEKEAYANMPKWMVAPFLLVVRFVLPIFLAIISIAQFL